jgi:hypothetical protein
VNSFKVGGEGLNFAVSVDDVKKFVTRPGNKLAERPVCKPKAFSSWRNKANDSTVTAYDLTCSGKVNANYIVPDKKSGCHHVELGTGMGMTCPMSFSLISNDSGNGIFLIERRKAVGQFPANGHCAEVDRDGQV